MADLSKPQKSISKTNVGLKKSVTRTNGWLK